MAMSRTEIVNRSNEKRGIKQKAFKLPLAVIAEIEQLSQQLGIPQNQLIVQAIELFKQSQKGA
ncbi:MAG: ribbon-helix-helix protein, CopG family [[Pasteurella] mairii]|nr:ribbon-helix-helix protein, CopG family [[Pasteurella] mairii]